MTQSVHRTTRLGPNAVTSHPLMMVPRIEPQPGYYVRICLVERGATAISSYQNLVQDQIANLH